MTRSHQELNQLLLIMVFGLLFSACGGDDGGGSPTTFSLSSTAVGQSQVNLSWTPASPPVSGYWVDREGAPINPVTIYTTSLLAEVFNARDGWRIILSVGDFRPLSSWQM